MTIHSPRLQRRGLTLTEALVAMFVAAIGMICLLALFPLGALQMGQALKDARCTETATNAEAMLRTHYRIEMLEKGFDAGVLGAMAGGDPVFVDPVGRLSSGANIAPHPTLNPGGQTNLTRQRLAVTPTFATTFRYCSLLDDMTFDESGIPVVSGGRVERAGRYNWTAVMQRTPVGETKLTVLIFDGRAAGFAAANSEIAYGDPLVPTRVHSFLAGSTALQLRFPDTDVRPPIGKGRWIAVFTPANHLLTFHRVVGITDTGAGTGTTTFDCELQTPIPSGTATSLGHDPANCRVIVFAGLAEVFERAPLTN